MGEDATPSVGDERAPPPDDGADSTATPVRSRQMPRSLRVAARLCPRALVASAPRTARLRYAWQLRRAVLPCPAAVQPRARCLPALRRHGDATRPGLAAQAALVAAPRAPASPARATAEAAGESAPALHALVGLAAAVQDDDELQAAIDASVEREYRTKRVRALGRDAVIVLQNENGPCPLLAIGALRSALPPAVGLDALTLPPAAQRTRWRCAASWRCLARARRAWRTRS